MSNDRRFAGAGGRRTARAHALGAVPPSANFGAILKGQWEADDLAATWPDRSGTGNHLTLSGTPVKQPAIIDSLASVSFPTDSDYASTGALVGVGNASRPCLLIFGKHNVVGNTWGTHNLSSDGTFGNTSLAHWNTATNVSIREVTSDFNSGYSGPSAPTKANPFLLAHGFNQKGGFFGLNGDVCQYLVTYADAKTAAAQLNLKLGGLYTGGFGGNGWITSAVLLSAAPTPAQMRAHVEWLASRSPTFATSSGISSPYRGVVVLAGQSNQHSKAYGDGYGGATANFMATAITRPAGVRFRVVCQQSTDIPTHWAKGTGERYNELVRAVQYAAASEPVVVDWDQGESDGLDVTKAAAYQANLSQLIADVEADSGRSDIFWCIRRLGTPQLGVTFLALIQAAQDAVVAALPARRVIINSNDLTCDGGNIHFVPASIATLWTRVRAACSTHYSTPNW